MRDDHVPSRTQDAREREGVVEELGVGTRSRRQDLWVRVCGGRGVERLVVWSTASRRTGLVIRSTCVNDAVVDLSSTQQSACSIGPIRAKGSSG